MAYKHCHTEIGRCSRLRSCKVEDLMDMDDSNSESRKAAIEGRVQFRISDLPYTFPSQLGLDSSNHDILTKRSMEGCARGSSKFLHPSAYILLFCGWDQIQNWRDVLKIVMYFCDSEAKRYSFFVDEQPLHFVGLLWNSKETPEGRSCRGFLATDCAGYLVYNGAQCAPQFGSDDYENPKYVSS